MFAIFANFFTLELKLDCRHTVATFLSVSGFLFFIVITNKYN
jgi:hypothetical protein